MQGTTGGHPRELTLAVLTECLTWIPQKPKYAVGQSECRYLQSVDRSGHEFPMVIGGKGKFLAKSPPRG